jgi:hypothetical protein
MCPARHVLRGSPHSLHFLLPNLVLPPVYYLLRSFAANSLLLATRRAAPSYPCHPWSILS